MHRTWTLAGPHKEAVARQRYAGVGGRQTQDDPVSGNTDTQGKRRGPSIPAFIKAEERGTHLWIQSVTPLQQQRRIVDSRFFVNHYPPAGAPGVTTAVALKL